MRIKTLLLLSAGMLVATTALIGATVYFASRQTNLIAAQGTQAEKVIEGVFELNQLGAQYVERFEERPRAQWYLQYEALNGALASPAFEYRPLLSRTLAEDRSVGMLLTRLHEDMADIRSSFDELVRRSSVAAANQEVSRQLSGDLLVKTQRMILDADALARLSFQERTTARMRTDRLILGLLALLALAAGAVLLLVYRRIAGPIFKLQEGAKIIGGGDLAHRIGSRSNDEIGQLALAFDVMAIKLKESHDLLEQKVRDRTRELQELSDKSQTLLQSIGDGVIAVDRYWNITLWNHAAERLTGWPKEEVLGKPFRERVRFIREHDRKENLAFIEEAMLYGETKTMSNSTLLLTRDGREVPVGDSAAPIFDEKGRVAGVIVVFHDASREKEASLLRTDFAYASHQLRTPINKALWSLEAAVEEGAAADENLKEQLAVALRGVQDVQKLSERLLMVSQIDQKRMLAEFQDIELAPFLKDVMDEASKIADKRGVKLVTPKVPSGTRLDADPKLFKKALGELLQNAVMYSQSGGKVEVELRLEPLACVLHVRDEGIGISDEQKPLIFTKFFRGQNVPADAAGAGLGLFIAREYARMMGGQLWFESELGKGSTFTISIPRLRVLKE